MGRKGRPMRRGPKSAKSKEAKPPATPKLPKGDGARVRDLEKRLAEALKLKVEALERERETGQALTEALERQTATSEILRAISSSPTDVQPIFDAIVESALRLCDGSHSGVWRVEGDMVHLAAHNHRSP